MNHRKLRAVTLRVKEHARAEGFDLVGIAPATPPPGADAFRHWLACGYHGEMAYLERRADERAEPGRVLPGAQSLIAVGFVYAPPSDRDSAPPEPESPAAPTGRIARYAAGADYHEVLGAALRRVGEGLASIAARPTRWRAYVDTGPVLEKAVAAAAGLGWIGKNTCLIHPRLGSYLFLGVVLTDLLLEPDPVQTDHCGTCRACLDVCPTGAFPQPYLLDARRCLAYTTIELRGAIPEPLREAQEDWVFGCDLCQEVCPWNGPKRRQPPVASLDLRTSFAPRPGWRNPSLLRLLELDEESWRRETHGSALRRAKFRGMLRNALIAAGNSGDPTLLASVERHASSSDALIAEHAGWAACRLRATRPRGRPAGDDPRTGRG